MEQYPGYPTESYPEHGMSPGEAPPIAASAMGKRPPYSAVHQGRRVAYPQRSEKTRKYRSKLSAAEYIHKKTFERPGYLGFDRPIRTTAPYIGSVLLAAGATVSGYMEVPSSYDLEIVKVMIAAYDSTYALLNRFLAYVRDASTGHYVSNVPIIAANFGGNANQPLILPVTWFINRSSQLLIDLTSTDAGNDQYVYITFLGIRYLYRDALNLTTGPIEDVDYKRM